jgi:cation:H+ antiporter
LDITPGGEVAEALQETGELNRLKAVCQFGLSLAAIFIGSEMLVQASERLMSLFGLSDTVFGMTILALLVSIEEVARELPAAAKGHPEITVGNVVGSVLAFFLFNAGMIALVRPVDVDSAVLRFYLPVCFVSVVAVSLFLLRRQVPRRAGLVLVLLYLFFALGGYVPGVL